MAKRDNGTKRANGGTTTTNASFATTADAMEQRVEPAPHKFILGFSAIGERTIREALQRIAR
jgi:hypothetical protein